MFSSTNRKWGTNMCALFGCFGTKHISVFKFHNFKRKSACTHGLPWQTPPKLSTKWTKCKTKYVMRTNVGLRHFSIRLTSVCTTSKRFHQGSKGKNLTIWREMVKINSSFIQFTNYFSSCEGGKLVSVFWRNRVVEK